jgi:hypothetical protein
LERLRASPAVLQIAAIDQVDRLVRGKAITSGV